MRQIFCYLILWSLLVSSALQGGCATDSSAGREAGRGATYGVIGGAVAGAVSSLIFGSNVFGGAAAGAAVGAAAGAATGAVSGSMADKERKKTEEKAAQTSQKQARDIRSDPKFAELEKEIGKKNFEATTLVAECRHREAIGAAEEAYAAEKEPNLRLYALYIKAIAAEESGNKELASSIYPKIVQEDPKRGNVEKARADALEGIIKVQKTRQEHGLPPLCK